MKPERRVPKPKTLELTTPPPPGGEALSHTVIELCHRLGFVAVGVGPATPITHANELREWLNTDKHGEMRFMQDDLAVRLDPSLVLDGTKSMIMVADAYAHHAPNERPAPTPPLDSKPQRPRGLIARYAQGSDYHHTIKRRLRMLADTLRPHFPGHTFRSFADTAPIHEREVAAALGLGWIGKHTLLINPNLGSYLLLGGIGTSLELPKPRDQHPFEDHCGSCTRCIDACPTKAITPYTVDARLCISYLTIEHESPIAEEFERPIGSWLAGCDICQDVCPHNSKHAARERDFQIQPEYSPRRDGFDLLEVLRWTERDRRNAFQTSALKRLTLAMMKRNAIIALSNHIQSTGDRSLLGAFDDVAWRAAEPQSVRELASRLARRLRQD
ncbi:MAG: tRNA epoxyqueuosine(34) reductase QueG [Phycisphaerales bacterium]